MRRYIDVIDRFVAGLAPTDEADRAAGLEIAVASHRFSRRTKAVVDDKLSFSATLMRAGEVEAANRLLAEVENEVLTEEAALLEKVNEVKIARAIQRPRVTRLRLARALAVAVLGSSLLASSAVGMAVAGLFRDRDGGVFDVPGSTRSGGGVDNGSVQARAGVGGLKKIRVAGIPLRLTPAELREYHELTSGDINEKSLQTFLLSVLPPSLAVKVHSALVIVGNVAPDEIKQPVAQLDRKLEEERRKATSQGQEAAEEQPKEDQQEPADEPSPEPSPSDDEGNENPDDEGPSLDDLPIGD
ncbi:MAG: hypothetical protein M3161_02195 [Actinomycetota bacterium]|nr:hypothetical protein [Actinomycetota bacterium]